MSHTKTYLEILAKRDCEGNMSIVKSLLEKLYERNEHFEGLYPIEETSIKLQTFITSELMQGGKFLHPKRFGISCGYDEGKALVLLMAISSMKDNGLLHMKYLYTFPDGEERLLNEDELKHIAFVDEASNEKMTLYDAILEDKTDILFYIEIDKNLKKEILG